MAKKWIALARAKSSKAPRLADLADLDLAAAEGGPRPWFFAMAPWPLDGEKTEEI